MFIENKTQAMNVMSAFMQTLNVPRKENSQLNFLINSVSKDFDSGFVDCAFETIEKLPQDIQDKVPASFHKLQQAREVYCTTDFSDVLATDGFQHSVNEVIREHYSQLNKVND
jgi:hypothetical protein